MVGKSWSDAEERYFWREVVPYSTSRVGRFLDENEGSTWGELARRMSDHFGANARRQYTHEHWFLNVQIGTRSPNAEPYLSRFYQQARAPNPYHTGANAPGQRQAAAVPAGSSVAPSAPVATPSGAVATALPAVRGWLQAVQAVQAVQADDELFRLLLPPLPLLLLLLSLLPSLPPKLLRPRKALQPGESSESGGL
ncbi:hypothetical protein PG993_011291 [Apiospora rasikravindrae]|uniref:Myb-like domain-containing protein n=1 Tax=Apiospora rasikravindrae TaxID=990691 RepID=A0ABR1SF23_9PEZI